MNRRSAILTLGALPFALRAAPTPLPVAAVVTEYRTNSHADVIIGKILEGWKQDGGPGPSLKLVAMYVDQFPKPELSRALAKKHGFPITKTIGEAITLGTGKVQVAGVLSIGEHGKYPFTEKTRQHMYPRRRFFDAIADTLEKCGKPVPVFNDKHLAYNWKDAKHMHDRARKLKIPFMAGSSLPVAWRLPALKLPLGTDVEFGMGVGYAGLESYGFHALEGFQCIFERRKGGETGVASVRAVAGEAIWKTLADKKWSFDLLLAALRGSGVTMAVDEIRRRLTAKATIYLMEYRDGRRGAVAMANGIAREFAVALKLRGQAKPFVNHIWLQDRKPYRHFEHLLRGIEPMIHTGQPTYPVERTLLTTGILDRVMHSVAEGGRLFKTPELAIRYQPTDWEFANWQGKFPRPL